MHAPQLTLVRDIEIRVVREDGKETIQYRVDQGWGWEDWRDVRIVDRNKGDMR